MANRHQEWLEQRKTAEWQAYEAERERLAEGLVDISPPDGIGINKEFVRAEIEASEDKVATAIKLMEVWGDCFWESMLDEC